jgi:hypothetical protein
MRAEMIVALLLLAGCCPVRREIRRQERAQCWEWVQEYERDELTKDELRFLLETK